VTLRVTYPRTVGSCRKIPLLATLFMLVLVAGATAQPSIGELESNVNRLVSDARELYRFDEDARAAIWDAYCGKLDPVSGEKDVRFAAEVGQTFQQREHDKVEPLLSRVQALIKDADRLREKPDTKSKAEDLIRALQKEYDTLHKLDDGVVLRGSNHPFTQAAIEYGKAKHRDMCGSYGNAPRICDQPYPELNGRRPDLVYVSSSGLFVMEFKPEGAKDLGEQQVRGYVDGVTKHYQRFFPKGRKGGIAGSASDAVGGESFLAYLASDNQKEAWSSDGMTLKRAESKVETYRPCEQPK